MLLSLVITSIGFYNGKTLSKSWNQRFKVVYLEHTVNGFSNRGKGEVQRRAR